MNTSIFKYFNMNKNFKLSTGYKNFIHDPTQTFKCYT